MEDVPVKIFDIKQISMIHVGKYAFCGIRRRRSLLFDIISFV